MSRGTGHAGRTLRVCDFGRVSARRSQTLWHAIARGVAAGAPPTLSFMRPARPYVGVGYHRPLAEVDVPWCRSARLPVYRRQAGGGVVYLDSGQLFFQITLPEPAVPAAGRQAALCALLAPAVAAFRAAGVDARLDAAGEITVGEAKVCGHAAAQIGGAVVVVGNLIESFDHSAAVRVLALPEPARTDVERLMRRYVAATPADTRVFRRAAVEAYADALRIDPDARAAGELTGIERAELARLDRLFGTASWRTGPVGDRPLPPVRVVKLRAGVFVVCADGPAGALALSVVGGRVERATATGPGRRTVAVSRRLVGLDVGGAGAVLREAGGAAAAWGAALDRVRLVA